MKKSLYCQAKHVLMYSLIVLPMSDLHAANADLELDTLVKMSLEELLDIEVITVATGAEQSQAKAPSSVTVITAQDIEMKGARTLEEALKGVPGFQLSVPRLNTPVYIIRGLYSGQNAEVLVLLNGTRVNDNQSGGKGLYWGGFPVSAIARIEIIRGPGSAVYGADASAGVINIVTRNAQDIAGTEIGVRAGSFDTQDAWVNYGGRWNGFDLALMTEFDKTDGHRRTVEHDAQSAYDRIFGTSASLAPGAYGSQLDAYDLRLDVAKQYWRLRAGLHKTDDQGNGVGAAQALEATGPLVEQRLNADLTYHNTQLTAHWDITAQLAYQRRATDGNLQLFPPGAFGGAYPLGYLLEFGVVENNTQLSLSGFYRGFDKHLIRLGAGYGNYDETRIRHIANYGLNPYTGLPVSPLEMVDLSDTPAAFLPETQRENRYVFAQDTWTVTEQWELTGGVRYDHYSDFGSTVNPRLGLVWEARPGLFAKLLYGKAFRAPSLAELYSRNNPVALGNPDVKPEKVDTWELSFDYQADDSLHLALNLFYYQMKDKVGFAPTDRKGEYQAVNSADWDGRGAEFEARWKPNDKLGLSFNYSLQYAPDAEIGGELGCAPQHAAYLRGDYLLSDRWSLSGQAAWSGDWQREVRDPRPDLDGNTTLDLSLRRKDKHTTFALGVRNLFDEDVRYPSPGTDIQGILRVPNDQPGAGRSYLAEFRYTF